MSSQMQSHQVFFGRLVSVSIIFTFNMFKPLLVPFLFFYNVCNSDVVLESGSVLESLFRGLGLGLEPTGLGLKPQDSELDSALYNLELIN